MTHIYLCGAHSTGKTTLMNNLKSHLRVKFVEEVARNIIHEHGWSSSDFAPKTNPHNFEILTAEILQKQIQLSEEYEHMDTIFERCLDPLVYEELYIGPTTKTKLYDTPGLEQWIQRMRHAIVFLVFPHPECAFDDGVRIPPDSQEQERFTQLLRDKLRLNRIPYDEITMLDMKQRVQFVLEKVRQVKPELIIDV
ncbi:hypothetical protein ACJMK2_031400 [Sinanodonta woodiana]|uniref:NadR/Ttd14 AAA domain-containing protein n=1 Tax=Sinanodonta woodiana TaxID=1069815 RepID=A0ABD3X0G7_SINWO